MNDQHQLSADNINAQALFPHGQSKLSVIMRCLNQVGVHKAGLTEDKFMKRTYLTSSWRIQSQIRRILFQSGSSNSWLVAFSKKNTKHIEAQLAYRDKHWSANWEVTNLTLCRGRLTWKVDNTVYWINLYPLHNILVFLILDHWIVIYLVDSTVQCLNNWDKTNTQGLKITEENENVLS